MQCLPSRVLQQVLPALCLLLLFCGACPAWSDELAVTPFELESSLQRELKELDLARTTKNDKALFAHARALSILIQGRGITSLREASERLLNEVAFSPSPLSTERTALLVESAVQISPQYGPVLFRAYLLCDGCERRSEYLAQFFYSLYADSFTQVTVLAWVLDSAVTIVPLVISLMIAFFLFTEFSSFLNFCAVLLPKWAQRFGAPLLAMLFIIIPATLGLRGMLLGWALCVFMSSARARRIAFVTAFVVVALPAAEEIRQQLRGAWKTGILAAQLEVVAGGYSQKIAGTDTVSALPYIRARALRLSGRTGEAAKIATSTPAHSGFDHYERATIFGLIGSKPEATAEFQAASLQRSRLIPSLFLLSKLQLESLNSEQSKKTFDLAVSSDRSAVLALQKLEQETLERGERLIVESPALFAELLSLAVALTGYQAGEELLTYFGAPQGTLLEELLLIMALWLMLATQCNLVSRSKQLRLYDKSSFLVALRHFFPGAQKMGMGQAGRFLVWTLLAALFLSPLLWREQTGTVAAIIPWGDFVVYVIVAAFSLTALAVVWIKDEEGACSVDL